MRFLKNKVAKALQKQQESETRSEPDVSQFHSVPMQPMMVKLETPVFLSDRLNALPARNSLLNRREVALPLIKFKHDEMAIQQQPAPFTAPVKREFRMSPFVSPQTMPMVKGVFNDFTIKTSPMTQATSKGAFSDFSMKMSPFTSPHKAPTRGHFQEFSLTQSAAATPSMGKKPPQSNKNIVKNYARAMVNFALSNFAVPFLVKIVRKEGISLQEFKIFIQDQKEEINSIKTLRAMLLISEEEGDQAAAYKRVFRDICEVFIKFFAVNWIFDSKISDRLLHLKYRFKILRRVRNPEHFTYLENFNKTR